MLSIKTKVYLKSKRNGSKHSTMHTSSGKPRWLLTHNVRLWKELCLGIAEAQHDQRSVQKEDYNTLEKLPTTWVLGPKLVPGRAESLRCRVISPSPALSIYLFAYLFVYLFLWCWGLNLGLCARHRLYHWASCLDLGQNKSLIYKFLKIGIWNKVSKSLCMWKP